MRGCGRGGHASVCGQRWAWAYPGRARDHYARVISDRKWPLKKRPVIAHIKARSKHSFLTINCNNEKRLIRPNQACGRVPGTVCSVCVCINAGFIASSWAWLHGPMLGH